MKKFILVFIAAIGALGSHAQNINPEGDNLVVQDENPVPQVSKHKDSLFTGWAIDANLLGGVLTQDLTANSVASAYHNALNPNSSSLKFNNGMSYGIDAEVDRFFGKNYHFGVGVGVLYLYQQGNVTMDHFHVEYQSIDNFGNTFRQLITADNQIKETLNISNFNIPILFKYKTKFSQKFGFTADAGLLVNLQETSSYNTNASFDYEAIYKSSTNESGGTSWVYDNSPTPGANDILITKSQYLANHTNTELQNYFNTLKGEGYNVGLGVKPNNGSGKVSYNVGSLGLLVRPAISYYFSDNLALNLGLYYIYQGINNNASSNNQITNKIGSYSSVLNNVTSASNNSYGISIGIRYFFNKKKRELPEMVPVTNDTEPIPAPVVSAPPAPAPVPKEEKPEEDEEDNTSVSTPILFDLDKTSIKPSSYPVLDKAARKMDENKDVYLEINGYTDITGTPNYNIALSKKRAAVVKHYLQKKGVDPKLMKTVGHGAKSPAASNKTKAGRAQNRRVIMKIKPKGK